MATKRHTRYELSRGEEITIRWQAAELVVTQPTLWFTDMAMRDEFEPEEFASIDYSRWFQRVLGWDAILPFVVSMGSIVIANAFDRHPPADIIALAGLPAVGFWLRWTSGYRQIKSNACGSIYRGLQVFALFIGLCALMVADFFTALSAFIANANPRPEGVTIVIVAVYLVYLLLAIFATYPGRLREGYSVYPG